jgi:CHASE2 domain-containing sensor protein
MSHSRSRKKVFARTLAKEPVEHGAHDAPGSSGHGRFLPHLIKALPIILGLSVVMFFCEELGLFTGFETTQLDSMLRLQPRKMSKQVVVVEISNQDYHNPDLFYGTSPLDPSTALDLIESVKKYSPSVIGVDLETTDWLQVCDQKEKKGPRAYDAAKCDKLRKRIDVLMNEQTQHSTLQVPSIVWAAIPRSSEMPGKLDPVLGGVRVAANRQGVPQFPMDRDGAVRHYLSRIEVAPENGQCPAASTNAAEGTATGKAPEKKCYVPTLARAIFDAYPVSGERPDVDDEAVIFNFYGDRYRFPIIEASNFFPDANGESRKEARDQLEATRASLLGGKIVLIGGGYKEARDEYFTPLGPMKGVELNALAIQTDLSGGGIRETRKAIEFGLDLVIGGLIVWLFFICGERPRKALMWSLLIFPAAMAASLLVFKTAAYWFNFVPLACGVIFHQLFELAEGTYELQEKLEAVGREPEHPAGEAVVKHEATGAAAVLPQPSVTDVSGVDADASGAEGHASAERHAAELKPDEPLPNLAKGKGAGG